jgi:hypothetical protein
VGAVVTRPGKAARLRAALLALLAEHERDGALPTSARFLFYELVQRSAIRKSAPGPRQPSQDVSDALTQLRESGRVPWEWIVDETRSLDGIYAAASVMEWVGDMLSQARISPWNGERPPLIITESRSLAGVLRRTAYDYAVRIAASSGQTGGFLHTQVAPRLITGQRVLYLGDLDLAGGQIEANTRKVLERYAPLEWERLAITPEQVAEHRLPVITKRDRRYGPKGREGRDGSHYGRTGRVHEAVETEALSQAFLVRLLAARLDDLLPVPLDDVQERERAQRAALARLLSLGDGGLP